MKEQGSKSRLDRIVESAGTGLAAKTNRRGFLGKVAGTTTAVLFGGSVLLGEKKEAQAGPYTGCYWADEINIAFWPNQVVNLPAGNYLWLLKGPDYSAPVVRRQSDGQGAYLSNGNIVGHYCKATNGCTSFTGLQHWNPSSGWWYWIWGGSAGTVGNQSGWVSSYYLANAYDTYTGSVCGPAGAQFDVRCPTGYNCRGGNTYGGCKSGISPCASPTGCKYDGCSTCGSCHYSFNSTNGYKTTISNGDTLDSCQYYKIRFNPNGHAFGYVVPGDKLHSIGYTTNFVGGARWHCVTACVCAWLPSGCRGWIASQTDGTATPANKTFFNSIDPVSCSGGTGTCPPGSQG